MIKYINKFLKYFFSIALLTSSLLILFYVSIPLFSVENNELNKKEVIGMKPSVPIEFSANRTFWWLVRGENTLEFHNSSDEKIKGNIILTFEPNPCNFEEKIEILNNNKLTESVILPSGQTNIKIPVEIDYKSNQLTKIIFGTKDTCFVNNGDSRDFGAKLVLWSFE